LEFEDPDPIRFPALRLAREALEGGGAKPAILNAANEVAVAAFFSRRITFGSIATIVEATLDRYQASQPATLEDVMAIDGEARRVATQILESFTA
jgi:1-deoxy-D-xylulose-5-phosphate reductoisomerase